MITKILTTFKNFLSRFRKFIFKNYREHILSKILSREMERVEKIDKKKVVKILDFGSGHNPVVIKEIIKNLSDKYKNTKFLAYCYDFYSQKEIKIMNKNSNIKFLNIKNLSNNNLIKFNFCLIVDVLHHIRLEKEKKIFNIVKKLKKKSKFLIIKDHFKYGFFSNLALIIMDFVGNYGDNVKIPKTYFSVSKFENFLSKLNFV
tara:strand:- start:169 stop:777 length:609 start_codon:yes stop_codon:yes gene_type:complete